MAVAFALRTLLLIGATALWSDELYSVGKPAEPLALLGMRQDTHPPLYYGLLWSWGQLVGQTPSVCGCSPGWPIWLGAA